MRKGIIMSMSTYVIGFRPPDEEWKKKEKAFNACMEANVEVPDELRDFFGGDYPDEAGVEVDVKEATEEYHDESRSGFQVDLQKLPKGIKYLRFVNSW